MPRPFFFLSLVRFIFLLPEASFLRLASFLRVTLCLSLSLLSVPVWRSNHRLSFSLFVLGAAFYAPFTSSVFPFVSARLLLFLLFPSSAPSASFSFSFSFSFASSFRFVSPVFPSRLHDRRRSSSLWRRGGRQPSPPPRATFDSGGRCLFKLESRRVSRIRPSFAVPTVRPDENPTK